MIEETAKKEIESKLAPLVAIATDASKRFHIIDGTFACLDSIPWGFGGKTNLENVYGCIIPDKCQAVYNYVNHGTKIEGFDALDIFIDAQEDRELLEYHSTPDGLLMFIDMSNVDDSLDEVVGAEGGEAGGEVRAGGRPLSPTSVQGRELFVSPEKELPSLQTKVSSSDLESVDAHC